MHGDFDAVRHCAEQVVAKRPDLNAAQVIEQIDRLSNDTVYGRHHWAQVCVDRAQADSPLPWEAGYIESRYLALLSRSPS